MCFECQNFIERGSKILDLGEGTIRAILDILKKNKLLESNNKGHYLSAKGNIVVKKIKNKNSTINTYKS